LWFSAPALVTKGISWWMSAPKPRGIRCGEGQNMIKAITFDYWQTLYADYPELNRKRQDLRIDYCQKFLAERGYSVSPDKIEAGFEAAFNHVNDLWHQHRGVPVEECMERLTEMLDIHLDSAELERLILAVGEAFFEVPPVLMPHASEVLARLNAKYHLAIISDAGLTPGHLMRRLMERHDILKYFAVQTFSDETAHTKPEVVQFHSTLKQLNVSPAEAVHIGDLVRTDIIGAKNAGMKAIRFSCVTQTKQNDRLSDAVVDDYRELEDIIGRL
jgi:HAD superfamily hydrolase (TIGR01549 family)